MLGVCEACLLVSYFYLNLKCKTPQCRNSDVAGLLCGTLHNICVIKWKQSVSDSVISVLKRL